MSKLQDRRASLGKERAIPVYTIMICVIRDQFERESGIDIEILCRLDDGSIYLRAERVLGCMEFVILVLAVKMLD
jgi:hypothetical protein